ncbi:class IV adenylate cyclase [Archaeoglobales archaeon]|nr:MAG: class IV adenylate cyclase [Archaeoglobales archaeon]
MEVEVKFKAYDGVEERIKEMADFVIEKFEEDLYFNHPCKDFKESDEALRVRKDKEGIKVTYKGAKVDKETKSREEIKLKVDDFDKSIDLFKKLGFKPVREVVKLRRIYRIGDAIICYDEVKGLGNFVEIEIESDFDGFEEAKQRVFKIAKMLGFNPKDNIRKSYLELLEESGLI